MNGIYSKVTSDWPFLRYSQAHPDALMRGWLPTNGVGADFTDVVLYAQGSSWGGLPFYASEVVLNDPNTDNLERVAALMDAFRQLGYAVFHVNYPVVAGSPGLPFQLGPAAMWPEITLLLATAIQRTRAVFPLVRNVVTVGSSAGGVSWGKVAAAPPSTYLDRPDALIVLETPPAMERIASNAPVVGGQAYLTGDPAIAWSEIKKNLKTWTSPLQPMGLQTGGPGQGVPVGGGFAASADLAGHPNLASLLSAWDAGAPIPGYLNPHSPVGGAGLEHALGPLTGRPAPVLVSWGTEVSNPEGLLGIKEAAQDPDWSAMMAGFIDMHLE